MKKYMIPVAAMLLFAGVAGAQTTHPAKATVPKKEATAKKTMATDKSTASVTSMQKTGSETKATAVTRKHHHRKAKPSKKTEGK